MLHINRYPVFPSGYHKKQSGFGPLSGTLIEKYDARYVLDPESLASDPDYGVPNYLWINGDGDNPRIVPNPALVYTTTGVLVQNGITPHQKPDGTDLLMETYSGASYRRCVAHDLSPVDPVNDDMVVAVSGITP